MVRRGQALQKAPLPLLQHRRPEVLDRELHPRKALLPRPQNGRRGCTREAELHIVPPAALDDLEAAVPQQGLDPAAGEAVVPGLPQRLLHRPEGAGPVVRLRLVAAEQAIDLHEGDQAPGAQKLRPQRQQRRELRHEVLHGEGAPDEVRRRVEGERGRADRRQVHPLHPARPAQRARGAQHLLVGVHTHGRPAAVRQEAQHLAGAAAQVERNARAAVGPRRQQRLDAVEHRRPRAPGGLTRPLDRHALVTAGVGIRHYGAGGGCAGVQQARQTPHGMR